MINRETDTPPPPPGIGEDGDEMYDDEYDLLLSAVRVLSLVEVTSKRLHQTIEVTKHAISYGITTVRTDTDQMWIWE